MLRLGFEAGSLHAEALREAFDGSEYPDEGIAGASLEVCLEERTGRLRDLLSDCFGGNGALFWSLYSSIWPKVSQPAVESLDELLGLRQVEYSELELPWLFVCDGWVDVESA